MAVRKNIKIIGMLSLFTLILSACSLPLSPAPTLTKTATTTPLPSTTETLTLTPSLIASPSPTFTSTPTASPTLTLTPTFTQTVTPSLTPTYALLRGEVIPEHLNCRYGPGRDVPLQVRAAQGQPHGSTGAGQKRHLGIGTGHRRG